MINRSEELKQYLVPGKHVHLVGIGGVSMAPLAEVLQGEGLIVTGSDMNEGDSVRHLRQLGIPVVIGHLPGTVAQVDVLAGHQILFQFFTSIDHKVLASEVRNMALS